MNVFGLLCICKGFTFYIVRESAVGKFLVPPSHRNSITWNVFNNEMLQKRKRKIMKICSTLEFVNSALIRVIYENWHDFFDLNFIHSKYPQRSDFFLGSFFVWNLYCYGDHLNWERKKNKKQKTTETLIDSTNIIKAIDFPIIFDVLPSNECLWCKPKLYLCVHWLNSIGLFESVTYS